MLPAAMNVRNPSISVERVWPFRHALRITAGVLGFALLTALGAQVAVPLPYTPVPATLQTLVVLLAGIVLGPRWGTVSMLFYVLLGVTGYHVFALGRWGLPTVLGPTGGYLIGFVLAQPVIGRLARPGPRPLPRVLAAVLTGKALIYACGLAWLAAGTRADLTTTLLLGFWPFVPGLLLKASLATLVGSRLLNSARGFFNADRTARG